MFHTNDGFSFQSGMLCLKKKVLHGGKTSWREEWFRNELNWCRYFIDQPWKLWTSCHFPFMNSSIGIDCRWKACASMAGLKDRTKRGDRRTAYGPLTRTVVGAHRWTHKDWAQTINSHSCTVLYYFVQGPSLMWTHRQTSCKHIQQHIHLAKWPSAVSRRDEITVRTHSHVEREQEGR